MVHKLILIHRCTYFQRMLEHDRNEVIIEDSNIEAVRSFVRYLYTDKIEHDEKLVEELMVLADKFCMLALKRKCESQLMFNMNETNVIDLLILADKYNCRKFLKEKAFRVIKNNLQTVKKSEGYKKLREMPQLKGEIDDMLDSKETGISVDGVNFTISK